MAERTTTTTLTVSLPHQVAADLREVAGRRGVSAYVADAVELQLMLDRMRELVDDYESTHPPLTEAEIEAASRALFGTKVLVAA